MYSSFASMTSSPLVYWFTLGMLIAAPLAMFIIGIRGVRKDNPNDKRAGYAMLKLAGVVTAIMLIGFVYLFVSGAFSPAAAGRIALM